MNTVTIRSKWNDYNARGKGTSYFRMVADIASDGTIGPLMWADKHPEAISNGSQRLSDGRLRSSDRHATCYIDLPVGLLVITIAKGNGAYAGILAEKEPGRGHIVDSPYVPIKHHGTKRRGNDYVHVVQIGAKRFELTS